MNIRMYRSMNRARKGFTLLEMMLVVMIMGVLLGVAAWNIASTGTKARRATTVATMKQVSGMIDVYNLDYGVYPASLDVLVPKYTSKMPVDAWKQPIRYSLTSGGQHPYQMFSNGTGGDSPANAEDVIDYWTEEAATNAHP